MRVDDVLAPHRQAELEGLTGRLASFQPTKICVEVTPERQAELDELFTTYLSGAGEERAGEIHQIAFRLAQRLGIEKVMGIDDPSPMEWDGLDRFFASNPTEDQRFKGWVAKAQVEAEKESEALSRTPIHEYLLSMNETTRLHAEAAWYVDIAGLGGIGEHAGVHMLASWYRRNIGIFSNLAGLTAPGDRIFVLFGAGHIPILRQLIEFSSRHHLVDPAPYLR